MADHDDGHDWRMTSHVCRVCFGRVLRRLEGDRRIYRCSNCGIEQEGHDSRVICACGMKLKTGANAGLRCVPNLKPTPEFPAQVVVEQVSAVKK